MMQRDFFDPADRATLRCLRTDLTELQRLAESIGQRIESTIKVVDSYIESSDSERSDKERTAT